MNTQALSNIAQQPITHAANRYETLSKVAAKTGIQMFRYLNFDGKAGRYNYRDSSGATIDIATGTEMAVNIDSINHGYVCWVDSKNKGSAIQLITKGELPDQSLLPDHGPYLQRPGKGADGWRYQISIPLAGLHDKIEYVFNSKATSSVNSLRKFIATVGMEGVAQGSDMIPIVKLEVGVYQHAVYGTQKFPTLKIARWVKSSDVTFNYAFVSTSAEGADANDDNAPIPQEAAKPAGPVKAARRGATTEAA